MITGIDGDGTDMDSGGNGPSSGERDFLNKVGTAIKNLFGPNRPVPLPDEGFGVDGVTDGTQIGWNGGDIGWDGGNALTPLPTTEDLLNGTTGDPDSLVTWTDLGGGFGGGGGGGNGLNWTDPNNNFGGGGGGTIIPNPVVPIDTVQFPNPVPVFGTDTLELPNPTWRPVGAIAACPLDCYTSCKQRDIKLRELCKIKNDLHARAMKAMGCKGTSCSTPAFSKSCSKKRASCAIKKVSCIKRPRLKRSCCIR